MRRNPLYCFIDESGSLQETDPRPFRVGFLLTCHPRQLAADLRTLKRELPPRSTNREYHAREDSPATRAALLNILSLHDECRLHVVEWRKEGFASPHYRNGRLQILADTSPHVATLGLIAADFAALALAKGFDQVHLIAEATKTDVTSEHRSRKQAFSSVFPIMADKRRELFPDERRQAIVRLSTLRKQECPILSFADVWLWALGRASDQHGQVLPARLLERTSVTQWTAADFTQPSEAAGLTAI